MLSILSNVTHLDLIRVHESTGIFNLYSSDGTVCSYSKSDVIKLLWRTYGN